MGLLTSLLGLDIADIASVVTLVVQICLCLVNICIVRLPKKLPEAWANSRYHMSNGALTTLVVFCTILGVVNLVALASTMDISLLIGLLLILVAGVLYIVLRQRSGKVHMEISYEAE